jgi:hypothetical protein
MTKSMAKGFLFGIQETGTKETTRMTRGMAMER